MFDDSTHTCPSGHVIYQFSTILNEHQTAIDSNESKEQETYEEKVDILMSKLKEVRGQDFESSIEFVTSYIRINLIHDDSSGNKDELETLLRGY